MKTTIWPNNRIRIMLAKARLGKILPLWDKYAKPLYFHKNFWNVESLEGEFDLTDHEREMFDAWFKPKVSSIVDAMLDSPIFLRRYGKDNIRKTLEEQS